MNDYPFHGGFKKGLLPECLKAWEEIDKLLEKWKGKYDETVLLVLVNSKYNEDYPNKYKLIPSEK